MGVAALLLLGSVILEFGLVAWRFRVGTKFNILVIRALRGVVIVYPHRSLPSWHLVLIGAPRLHRMWQHNSPA